MTGRLTTHVLDLSMGRPASGVLVELWQVESEPQFVKDSYTNKDGRLTEPLLEGDSLKQGIYEIRFHVGDYFRKLGTIHSEPAFLDCVPVRFGVSERESHYHIPLLISPGGYSTYRGS
ncbi:hydroxyisourate hydrolase [Neobacillus jeddahensis]|uniref:hydroxyisourate hydrolase n=1 Tax=Neobacillus jeddahensis TaxID=1461580 RepID=UPI00058F96E5|nr:hydroxyisourate hydrolase [Neobacillus jeddahensis]